MIRVVLVLLLSVVFQWAPLAAKEFYVESVHVHALIQKNGDMRIRESRTYRFEGKFSWASYELSRKGYDAMELHSVSEEGFSYENNSSGSAGSYTFKRTKKNRVIKWHFNAENESRTFHLEYTISGAMAYGTDADLLHWVFLSSRFNKEVDNVLIEISFENDDSVEAIAWVTGNSTGANAVVNQGKVRYETQQLTKKESVIFQLVIPQAWVETDKKRLEKYSLAKIVERYEDTILKEIRSKERSQRLAPWADKARTVIILGSIAFFVGMYQRYGKRAYPTVQVPEFIDRPPTNTIPPAMIARLLNSNYDDPHQIFITLIDLSQRGYFRFREEMDEKKPKKKKVYLSRTDKPLASHLLPYEVLFIEWMQELLEGQEKPMNKVFDHQNKLWTSGTAKWYTKANEDIQKLDWFDKESRTMALAHGLIQGLLIFPLSIVTVIYAPAHPFLSPALVVVPFVNIWLSFAIAKRTSQGFVQYKLWWSFAKTLRAITGLKEEALSAERYLLWAITFRVSKKRMESVLKDTTVNVMDYEWYTSDDPNFSIILMSNEFSAMMMGSSANGGIYGGVGVAGGAAGGGAGGGAG